LTSLNKTQTFSPTRQTTSVLLVETSVGVNTVLILRRSSNTLYCADLLHLAIITSYSKLFCSTFSCRCSYCFLSTFEHRLTDVRTAFCCFDGLSPLRVLFSDASSDSHHCLCLFPRPVAIAFCYFGGLLPLLSLFLRPVAILRIAFLVPSACCHSAAILRISFLVSSACCHSAAILRTDFLVSSACCHSAAILHNAFIVSSTCCHSAAILRTAFLVSSACCHSAAILYIAFIVSSTCCHSACCHF